METFQTDNGVLTFDGVQTFQWSSDAESTSFVATDVESVAWGLRGAVIRVGLRDRPILEVWFERKHKHAAPRVRELLEWAAGLSGWTATPKATLGEKLAEQQRKFELVRDSPDPKIPGKDIVAFQKAERARTGTKVSVAEALKALQGGGPRERGRLIARFECLYLYEHWLYAGEGVAGSPDAVTAVVDAAGAIYARKTLTRVVLLGVLATQAKKDARELYLLLESPTFAVTVQVDPRRGAEARAFAAKVNMRGRQGSTTPLSDGEGNEVAQTSTGADIGTRLLRLKELLDAGAITEDDFNIKKAEFLREL